MPLIEAKTQHIIERLEKEPVFDFVKKIRAKFPEAEAYLVGGAVRDLFLERACKDYDFIIRNVPAQDLQDFLGTLGQTNLVGRVFGVFKFVPESHQKEFAKKELEPFDLALPRTEHAYLSGGYRDFDVQSDPSLPIEKDLARRDFTVNAIALDIANKKIIDPYNGLADLESKTIRAVGKPAERFKEDYSRMLRGLRQTVQLGFELDPDTLKTIKKNIEALTEKKGDEWIVPRETIAKEMIKAFRSDPVRAFDLCDETGVFKTLILEINDLKNCPQPPEFHSEGNAFAHTRLSLERLKSDGYKKTFSDKTLGAELVWALLLHDIGKLPSLKTPEKDGTDRIRFDGHNESGAKMAAEIINRLKLESMPDGTPDHISADKISWLIKNHLLLLNADPETMRASTIEKYFFNPLVPGDELIRLAYCDGMATIPKNGEPDMTTFKQMLKRIKEVGKLVTERNRLPPPLLDGDEIMKTLKLKPGPKVGEVIEKLRNAQLEGQINSVDEALKSIKKML